MTKYLHTMIRVSSLEDTIAFFEVLGLREIRRRPDEKGRYTNVFLAAPGPQRTSRRSRIPWCACRTSPCTSRTLGGVGHQPAHGAAVRSGSESGRRPGRVSRHIALHVADSDRRKPVISSKRIVAAHEEVRAGAAPGPLL
jgi:catechol 2,3-dioxygenase-like lactoylglutathione lyase family enzyme